MSCRYCRLTIETVEDVVEVLNTFLTLHRQLELLNHRSRICQLKAESIDSVVVLLQGLTDLYRELNPPSPQDLGSPSSNELVDPLL